jgi:diguanylate cyclase (GGDEF)-like protein
MPTHARDARLRELQFLARLDREGPLDLQTHTLDDLQKAMLAELIYAGHLNGIGTIGWVYRDDFQHMHVSRPENNNLFLDAERQRWNSINRLLGGQQVTLRISHAGRVRLSELEQALQTNRDREPFGILLGQRHVLADLAIAITRATGESPLTVAYLDANGFKTINDTLGHGQGDEALKSYMTVVSTVTERLGTAYRNGGDEVVVIMPDTSTDLALKTMRTVAAQLHKEKLPGDFPLSLSCGLATTTDPNADAAEFLNRADEEQKRAKERSREGKPPRPNVFAVQGKELEVLPWEGMRTARRSTTVTPHRRGP